MRQPDKIWEMFRMVATVKLVMAETQVRLNPGQTQMSREKWTRPEHKVEPNEVAKQRAQ